MVVAERIDHTLLRPDATRAEVLASLEVAVTHRCFGFVCQPFWVPVVQDAPIPIISIAGFPFGADLPETKATAAAHAAGHGASEIDIVLNLGALKSGDLETVAADVKGVRDAIPGVALKVILETGLLTAAQTEEAARICMAEGADWLKTSTGYGPRGATVEDVLLLKPFGPVKASAGIRTWEQASALIEAVARKRPCNQGKGPSVQGWPSDL